MRVDLLTLYLLAIGTLLASSGMTLWEHRSHPGRSRQLKILAAGYATLALGCAAAAMRRDLPGAWGSALSNLVIVGGYLLMLHGVAALNGRQHRRASIGILVALATTWALGGARWLDLIWAYASAVPIAIACGMTSRELLRNDGSAGQQSRRIAAIVSGGHALFYAARAFVLPWMVTWFGQGVLIVVGKITMYEGVLYSVVLPMTLLRLVRDEAHGQLVRESNTDYLTGVGNRRWFFEEGARIVTERGASRCVAVLAIDLDQFKTINDRYGHQAGDDVLKSFSAIARNVLGPHAVLARIGGEEFAAVLADHDGIRARTAGESIVRRFAGVTAHGADAVAIRATVSIGLAVSDRDAPTLALLLASADEALYRAKSLGGNRLECASRERGDCVATHDACVEETHR
ncbi:GGDEF domain-containing protein [Caballeronia concitans]|uniref:diguanylate cyclase n=1 Tax=Caballeronia concitans TaxID=1777133 RepID=A0A658QV59_9BURK|nr:GGDEF domain-containing protein [Caballeronia concitans]KIG07679.1 diguanylate cyclase [Burkholderia sp. MR1]SAL23997.1 diguanylate cyclase [Caballeronia concitans]